MAGRGGVKNIVTDPTIPLTQAERKKERKKKKKKPPRKKRKTTNSTNRKDGTWLVFLRAREIYDKFMRKLI